MKKVYVCSDIHLEFADYDIANNDDADILVLAGDICLAESFRKYDKRSLVFKERFINFFDRCSKNFKHVIYVAGNHEFYGEVYSDTIPILHDVLSPYDNIHLLERNSITIDGIHFHGCTLWTDLNKNDPITLANIRFIMNDYGCIYDEWSKLSPEKTYTINQISIEYLKRELNRCKNDVNIVITHHAPHFNSINPKYTNRITNGAYASDLTDMFFDHNIHTWIHGHCHTKFDYMINNTRVLCNPRGYYNSEKISINYEPELIIIGDDIK